MGMSVVPTEAYHSAVNSHALPIMSWAPHALTQRSPPPVWRIAVAPPPVRQAPAAPLLSPGSSVPRAAASHSSPDGRRFPLARHASLAWNHVKNRLGATDPRLAA